MRSRIIADPRDAQINRIKKHVLKLQERLSTQEQQNAGLVAFRTEALSRIAAQHEEITRLRGLLAAADNVRPLRHRPEPRCAPTVP